jgi:hypothetical protein
VTLLRLWLIGSVALLIGLAVWAFAPVLVFVVLLAVVLGILCALMIALARGLQAWRERR